ncbi:MAG TPA: nitrilase-related carbon-nitrogen hydrolase, partial [Ktedonobacterales bacterium]|nr:nitrilase-related carbon-nitrogen hydrolase [Ktedonobacterales bacterium]
MSRADFSLGSLGFARVAVVAPEVKVADVRFNTRTTIDALEAAAMRGCQLALFPELGLTGYTCADLFYQALLRDQARAALTDIAEVTTRLGIAAVVCLPIEAEGKLYNCAAFIANGAVLGLVPKTYLPSTNEYYEVRWFTSARECTVESVEISGGVTVPFGVDLLFPATNMPDCVVGVEVCEDLWAVIPPSSDMALAGATILLNPSGSDEVLGKAAYRRELIAQQSARCLSAYLSAGA